MNQNNNNLPTEEQRTFNQSVPTPNGGVQPPNGNYPPQPPYPNGGVQPPNGNYPPQPPYPNGGAQSPNGNYPPQQPNPNVGAQPPNGNYPPQQPNPNGGVQPYNGNYPPQPPYPNGQYPQQAAPMYYPVAPPKPKIPVGKIDAIVWFLSVGLGILLDRLIFAHSGSVFPFFSSFFWVTLFGVFTALNWNQVRQKKLYWLAGIFLVALSVMTAVYDSTGGYTMFASWLAIPVTLVFTFMYGVFDLNVFKPLQMVYMWFKSVFVFNFQYFGRFFQTISQILPKKEGKKDNHVGKIFLGLLIALPVVFILLGILSSSDEVFGFFLSNILENFSIGSFIWHIILIVLFAPILFSFLFSARNSKAQSVAEGKVDWKFDSVITYVVLSCVLVVYAVFCWVQFTYLFAGQGLPDGISYSSYAVSGFSEMIFVCSVNLIVFGLFLLYTKEHIIKKVLLTILLIFTGVMLCSSGLRLSLYIKEYDLTWLRLLSGWFIIFMGAVLLISLVRLYTNKIPAMVVCFFVLLGWFTALGYSNPEVLILKYNLGQAENAESWLIEEGYYLRLTATSDSILYLFENGYEDIIYENWISGDEESYYRYEYVLSEVYESPSYTGMKLREKYSVHVIDEYTEYNYETEDYQSRS